MALVIVGVRGLCQALKLPQSHACWRQNFTLRVLPQLVVRLPGATDFDGANGRISSHFTSTWTQYTPVASLTMILLAFTRDGIDLRGRIEHLDTLPRLALSTVAQTKHHASRVRG